MNKSSLLAAAIAGAVVLPVGAHQGAAPAENIDLIEQEKSQTNIFRAYFPSEDIARKAAISFHGQMLETHYDQGYMIMQLTEEEQERLARFGFRFEVADGFIAQRNTILSEMQNLIEVESMASMMSNSVSIAGLPGFSCYETVEETFAVAEDMTSSNPTLAEWIDVGDSWRKTNGLGGFDIKVLKLTNQNISGDKPKLFINSAIHAREYATAPLALDFARWLIDGYGTNADATWIMDHHEVHLMLQTNPDGRKRAETGLSWRKNTNQNYCGATSNSRGADLNRNFSFSWNSTNGQGSSGSQCNDTYRGPGPASEPEVQAMEAYVRSLWPDRRGSGRNSAAPADTSGIHIDIHSYSELVLWPWGDTSQQAPNGQALQTLGRKFAFFNDYSPQQSIGLYPTDGTSDAVSYGELGVAAYTFELGTRFFQECSTYDNTIKPDNLPALIYAAKVVRTPYLTPQGPDVSNLSLSDNAETAGVTPGTPVTLTASLTDTRYNNSNGSEATQAITAAEYYIDEAPWDSGATAIALSSTDGSFNETSETASAVIDTTGLSEGSHMVYVRTRDTNGWGAVSAVFLKIDNDPVEPPLEYCDAQGNNASEEWIGSVNIGGVARSSGSSQYSDFTEAQTGDFFSVETGSTTVELTPQFGGRSYNEGWRIWIDLNRDGDFSDSGEEVFSSGTATSSTVNGSLNIPATASEGKATMRVAMRYNALPVACGSFNYGEVEDYTVNITQGTVEPPATFENTSSYAIPDNNSTGVSSPISVTRDGDAGTLSVDVDISHTYKGDLIVDVIHPDGSVYNLHNRSGGSANDIQQTYSVNVGSRPAGGQWQLRVRDLARRDVGTINRWSITFD